MIGHCFNSECKQELLISEKAQSINGRLASGENFTRSSSGYAQPALPPLR